MGEPNMARLTPSRKRLQPGDIFAMHFPTHGYVFGRVIFAALPAGPMGPGSNLIYVYDHAGDSLMDVGLDPF